MTHRIIPMVREGHTARQISDHLGMPLSTVYYHIRKFYTKSEPPPIHLIIPMALEGHTARQISDELGIPLSTVYYHRRKIRADPPPPPRYRNRWRDVLVQEVYRLVRDEGMPYETAARNVIGRTHPERLACASGDPRPTTPRRLVGWTKRK